MAFTAAVLKSVQGEMPVLEDVRTQGTLNDLMLNISAKQTYRNLSEVNIEAVYTFPLPLDAVLLGFRVEIGERNLAGKIVKKSEGEEAYEDAITDGDTAILLEQIRPGMYSASVGNLMPSETAKITIDYALMLRWNGDKVRIHIPTTLAPFYGDPGKAGLLPHQTPEHSVTDERGFHLHVNVIGLLENAQFNSPSHAITVRKSASGTLVSLKAGAAMDRDFILEATSDTDNASGGLIARDLDGWVALASFRPEIPEARATRIERCSKIVVDCSGSMGGDSITQARIALDRIIDGLRDGDFFDIIAFGSHHQVLFGQETKVTGKSLDQARHFVGDLDANMGGTEIAGALRAAYQSAEPKGFWGKNERFRDILLITDGEVWETDEVIADARRSNHRVFTIGVGSAVQESFLRPLAQETGGACELVSPNEDMADHIHRHFQRMYTSAASEVQINWPAEPLLSVPSKIKTVFAGDTLHAFAWFADKPEGLVELDVKLADGRVIPHKVQLGECADYSVVDETPDPEQATSLARMAASGRMNTIENETEATDLAVRYQLISENTNCIVIDVRAVGEKAEDLPELRKVRQVMAAGWGGMGSVKQMSVMADRSMCMDLDMVAPASAQPNYSVSMERKELRDQLFDLPSADYNKPRFVTALNNSSIAMLTTMADLAPFGLDPGDLSALQDIVAQGFAEEAVVITFLYLFSKSDDSVGLERNVRRKIQKRFKSIDTSENLLAEVSVLMSS